MALTTYSELKTAITNHLDRDDLTDHIDDFIDLAESRHKRDIRIRDMLTRGALTVNARYVSFPSDYLEAIGIRLLTDPVTVLTYVDLYEMNRQRSEGTGKPTLFTTHSQIEFNKTPDSSYSGEIVYYGSLTALSDANTSNAILTRAPECYLYGALTASAPFLMHDERIQVWNGLYQEAKNELNKMDRRGRHIGPLFAKVAGATP